MGTVAARAVADTDAVAGMADEGARRRRGRRAQQRFLEEASGQR